MTENTRKNAVTDHQVHELITGRWSPYSFESREVERGKLLSCLEAARWAASSFNEQPWSFLVAYREDDEGFKTMLDCLLPANQEWAKHAGVLLLTVISKTFSRNDKPNRVAEHDLGLAVGNFTLQATALGLSVHQMAGVDLEKVRQAYNIPTTHDPITAIALGYATDPDRANNEAMAQRDRAPRSRKSLDQFVFSGQWEKPATL